MNYPERAAPRYMVTQGAASRDIAHLRSFQFSDYRDVGESFLSPFIRLSFIKQ